MVLRKTTKAMSSISADEFAKFEQQCFIGQKEVADLM